MEFHKVEKIVGPNPTIDTTKNLSGCSAVWSACLIWIQEVEGSNPSIPTNKKPNALSSSWTRTLGLEPGNDVFESIQRSH